MVINPNKYNMKIKLSPSRVGIPCGEFPLKRVIVDARGRYVLGSPPQEDHLARGPRRWDLRKNTSQAATGPDYPAAEPVPVQTAAGAAAPTGLTPADR